MQLLTMCQNLPATSSDAEKRKVTDDGLEAHMATNCLGPHLLTLLLLPALRAASEVCVRHWRRASMSDTSKRANSLETAGMDWCCMHGRHALTVS